MSSLTASTQPQPQSQSQLTVEDNEPDISPDQHRYIRSLNESPTCYSRFFSALLIKKSMHHQFFRDLKTFREQPIIIALLEPGTKEAYRECTRAFVGSRFAHPWCRTESDFKSGWTRASWVGGTRKVSKEDKKEEERLHRLLVPIWIAFQRRMFPGIEVVQDWVEKERREYEKEKLKLAEPEAEKTAKSTQSPSSGVSKATTTNAASTTTYPELGFKTKSSKPAPATSSSKTVSKPSDSSAAVASQMFMGVAVTGFIMSDKRVRKYMKKKLKK
ncbi:uncharacterized protein Z518_09521 [Rhinocladiella mackenziei CBS 650.93]|uniref:Uncharacterized protein n=1 Tax=Rhinocladiella mackenziei CBS 650.93 TaxID=1442369 RepID=A0A0D2I7G9_9EURO|nr:uncharacterized protein Z518_09521 [Rhinocladiella mackenziei CBS 650.93]KIX01794.1 hypothetical protein Z518_09521 [Rhinocladiella mackenziei CBS 650.93]